MINIDKNEILRIGKNAKEASRLVSLLGSKLKNDILKARFRKFTTKLFNYHR